MTSETETVDPGPALVSRYSKLLDVLHQEYPGLISGKRLMERIGLSWRTDPVCSFASLCSDVIAVNRSIRPIGWTVVRTGATPNHSYMLSPFGAG